MSEFEQLYRELILDHYKNPRNHGLLDPADARAEHHDAVSFDRGTDKIAAVRLGPKGPYRWYATCCKTPLGNTVKPSMPFIGIVHELFRDARDPQRRDELLGPPRASIWGQSAIGEPPAGSTKMNVPFLARTIRMILGWKLRGRAWPHPYFDRSQPEPKFPVRVLSRDERETARKSRGA